MSQAKISQLPAATLPLAGTELLELVQAGVNKQAPASAFSGGSGGGGDYTVIHTDFTHTPAADFSEVADTIVATYVLPGGTLAVKDELVLETVFVFNGSIFLDHNGLLLTINGDDVAKCQIPFPLNNHSWAGNVSDAYLKTRISLQNMGVANAQFLSVTFEQAATTTSSQVQNVGVISVFNEVPIHASNPDPICLVFRQALDSTADITFEWTVESDGQGLGTMNQYYTKAAQIVGH